MTEKEAQHKRTTVQQCKDGKFAEVAMAGVEVAMAGNQPIQVTNSQSPKGVNFESAGRQSVGDGDAQISCASTVRVPNASTILQMSEQPTRRRDDLDTRPSKRPKQSSDSEQELELGDDTRGQVSLSVDSDADRETTRGEYGEGDDGEEEEATVKGGRRLVEGSEGATSSDGPSSSPSLANIILSDAAKEIMQDDARHLDFWDWLMKYESLPMRVLLRAFDFELPEDMDDSEELLPLLKEVMARKVARRTKRQDINTIEDVLRLLQESKNIVVVTGAGVSVSCGIPDFRSKDGIYSRLEEFELSDPQEMFDIHYFRDKPQTFYSFIKEIYPSNFKPSPSHMFIKLLEKKGKLLRNYTQNIDTLEQEAGIHKVVQCHGSFATARCINCKYQVPGDALKDDIFAQRVPQCPKCSDESEYGIMKPDIVFFGEKLPDEFDHRFAEDRTKVDLFIAMGSSLRVSPVADMKDKIPHDIPQLIINRESLPHFSGFDVQLLGYCDTIVAELCRLLGWDLDEDQTVKGKEKETAGAAQGEGEEKPPPWTQGREPHIFLFEGAAGDAHPASYVPSDDGEDRDTSATSESSSGEEDSQSEEGEAGNGRRG
ncbi:NAD-dependent protein deacetylase sirtuin-1, partial [Borealophlyctis nickersoniae]